MKKRDLFTQAVCTYLQCKTGTLPATKERCHELLQTELRLCRGVWDEVSRNPALQMDASQCHDYYHNTWVLQFFDAFVEHRGELRELVRQAIIENVFDPVEAVRASFFKMFKEKNFNKHVVT